MNHHARSRFFGLRLVVGLFALVALSVNAHAFKLKSASNGMVLSDYGKQNSTQFVANVTSPPLPHTQSSAFNVAGAGAKLLSTGAEVPVTASAQLPKSLVWDGIKQAATIAGVLGGGPLAIALFAGVELANYMASEGWAYDPANDPNKGTANPTPFKKTSSSMVTQTCYGVAAFAGGACIQWGADKATTCALWGATAPGYSGALYGTNQCRLSPGGFSSNITGPMTRQISQPSTVYAPYETMHGEMSNSNVMPSPALIPELLRSLPDGLTVTNPQVTGPATKTGTPTVTISTKTETVIDPVTGKPTTRTTTTTTTRTPTSRMDYTNGEPVEIVEERVEVQVKTDTAKVNPDGSPVLGPDGKPVVTTTTKTGTTEKTGDPVPDEKESDLCRLHPDISACQQLGAPPETGSVKREVKDVSIVAAPFLSMAACPAPVSFTVGGFQREFSYGKACEIADLLKPLFLALAGVAAAFVLANSFKV